MIICDRNCRILATASSNDNSSSSMAAPVIVGLVVGILLVALFSTAFAAKGIQTNTEPKVLNDQTPKVILRIVVCADSNKPKLSTNSPDNPVVLRRMGTGDNDDSDGITIPLCIISSSSSQTMWQLYAVSTGDRKPLPEGLHSSFDYGVITTPAYHGEGEDKSIPMINNSSDYQGSVVRNSLHLSADESADPSTRFIGVEALDSMGNYYIYQIFVEIK